MSSDLYKELGLTTEVMSADPHKLIELLLGKALEQMDQAIQGIEQNDLAKKISSISKTIDIVIYLREILTVNDEQSSKMVDQLKVVYTHIEQSLVKANHQNDASLIKGAKKHLVTIQEAWSEMKNPEVAE